MAQDIRSAISEAFDVSGNMVTLFVGVDATPFHIHEKLICGRSEFFKAALSKSWNQTQERKVPLPKDDPEIVQIYLRYLYSGKLFTRIEDDDLWVEGTDNHPEYIVLAELLVFGEKVGDIKLTNDVTDAFLWRMSTPFGKLKACRAPITEVVDIIYKGTMPGSGARRLMIDTHTWRAHAHWFSDALEENNSEFLLDLAKSMARKRPNPSIPSPLEDAVKNKTYHDPRQNLSLSRTSYEFMMRTFASTPKSVKDYKVTD